VFIIDLLYESFPTGIPGAFAAADGAAAGLAARRHLDRGAICAPRHQAILETGSLSELSHKHHPGNGQRQNYYQPDQRRRPSLVGAVIATLRSVVHRLPKAVAAGCEHDMSRGDFPAGRRCGEIDLPK
jgi:hypothetical protein